MPFVLHLNEQGCLECSIDGSVIAVHEPTLALEAMSEALNRVEQDGFGECCWEQPTGIYRWVFRLNGDRANVALIWSTGVVTGWEHVWWGEVGWAEFARESKAQIAVAAAHL
jgi:hypothetical protein